MDSLGHSPLVDQPVARTGPQAERPDWDYASAQRWDDAQADYETMFAPQFVLKTTPPRVPRYVLERESLQGIWTEASERAAVTVTAPSGFGKTTLLAQWRLKWLERGALVAWLNVDEEDDAARFTMGLIHAVHSASSRPALRALLVQVAEEPDHDIDALTELLAEIARLGQETVLMIDDAERLPDATVQRSLQYLLRNAPPNLHVVIGSRVPLSLQTWEQAAKGIFAAADADDLRLRLGESTAVLGRHFGQRLNVDECARLHEVTGGWPLGLQLVAAMMQREPNLAAAIDSISARRGDIERYFFESLVSRLSSSMVDFLVRIAILEHLDVDLCEAVTGDGLASDYLEQLTRNTPIVMSAERENWVRLHPLARDFLLSRFEQLPATERHDLHARASSWFAERESFYQAACHALAAGDESLAQSYAVRSLFTLVAHGKLAEAREWLDRIPADVLAGDIGLHLTAAWIMALGERHEEALEIAQRVLADPSHEPKVQAAAARVAGGAAVSADRLGLVPGFFERWPTLMAQLRDSVYAVTGENILALVDLHAGATLEVRRRTVKEPGSISPDALPMTLAFNHALAGLSYLWDGDAYQAEATLAPALIEAERTVGRRCMVPCLFAAALAAALLERDQPAAAQALLANRLDVIDRTGFPDAVILAYRTLAYVALSQGDERRALIALGSLAALAQARNQPRLMMHSLAEQIRIYSLRDCLETVGSLVHRLDEMAPVFDEVDYRPFRAQYQLATAIAKAYAALAQHDLDGTEQQLDAAKTLAARTNRVRDALTVKVLQAVVARLRKAPHALRLLGEAVSLAAIGGNERLLADTHPLAVRMGAELKTAPTVRIKAAEPQPTASTAPNPMQPAQAAASRSGLLTSKEAEILALLGKGLSNKLIARAMDISDETVKWHIKNVFLKLAAGNRRHAVDRARLLGLLTH
jgi:LuxR family maltose regulon positive regulatory protein